MSNNANTEEATVQPELDLTADNNPAAAPEASTAPATYNDRTKEFASHIRECLDEMKEGTVKEAAAEHLHTFHLVKGMEALSNRARVLVALLLHPAHEALYLQVAGILRPSTVTAAKEADKKEDLKNFRKCLQNWLPGSTVRCKQSTDRWLLECLSLYINLAVEDNEVMTEERLEDISSSNLHLAIEEPLELAIEIVEPAYERSSGASNVREPVDGAHIKLANIMYTVSKASTLTLTACYNNVYAYLKKLVDWEEVGYELKAIAFKRAVDYLNNNAKAETMSKERVALFKVAYEMYSLSPAMFIELMLTGEVNLQNVVEGYTSMCVKIKTLEMEQIVKFLSSSLDRQSAQIASLEDSKKKAAKALLE